MKVTPHMLAFALKALYGGVELRTASLWDVERRTRLLPVCLAACRLPAAWPADSSAVFGWRALRIDFLIDHAAARSILALNR
jgi:hypothetical protein